MKPSEFSNTELLKSLLEPLLDDFEQGFARSRQLLESTDIDFLTPAAQADLLARLIAAQQEVQTTKSLFRLTEGQVGVEPKVLAPWHRLLTECWQISARLRFQSGDSPASDRQ